LTLLITGGAGFIGTKLISALESDVDIVVLDNLHPQVHGQNADFVSQPNVRFVRGDVTDPGVWNDLLPTIRPSTVVHLAAETGTGQSLLQASRHSNVNVNGTAVMLDALARHDVVPFAVVLTSSRAVYGEGAWLGDSSGEPFYAEPRAAAQLDRKEWAPRGRQGQTGTALPNDATAVFANPSNVYAATKLAQENILTAWCTSLEVGLSILRLQNVYGAGQALRNPYTGVLTHFARQTITGAPIELYEGGGIIRDFVHVSDVVGAILSAITSPPTDNGHRTLDIGSGAPDTLVNFASQLVAIGNGLPLVHTDKYRLGDVRSAFASNVAASAELGFHARTSFEQGAAELLEWARNEISRGE
jgi:dTDP-L-rhamnose 4-epimerase